MSGTIEAAEGEVEGPERDEDNFRLGGWRILGVQGGDERDEQLVMSEI